MNISCLDFEKNGFSLLSCTIAVSGDVRFRLNFNRNGGENGKVFGENGKVFGDPFLCMFSFHGLIMELSFFDSSAEQSNSCKLGLDTAEDEPLCFLDGSFCGLCMSEP